MELVLNLEWMVLAAAMCWLWTRHPRREGPGRPAQAVSLALVLFTMFTVITMYDDMAMARNAAEVRSFQREDNVSAHEHARIHPIAASMPAFAVEPPRCTFGFAISGGYVAPAVNDSVFAPVQNRPPPVA